MKVTKKDLETIIYGVRGKALETHGTGKALKAQYPGLAHVRVEPGRLVATDGHVMIIREVEHIGPKFEPFCISVADIKTAIKGNAEFWSNSGPGVVLDPGNDFLAKIGRKSVVKQDDKYVDWTVVVNHVSTKTGDFRQAKFNPEVLMRALQGMKDIAYVELRVWAEDKPVRLDGETADGRRVMAIAMPVVPSYRGA